MEKLLRSPCLECGVHLAGVDKEDLGMPCGACRRRIAYADAVEGMPARMDYWYDTYGLLDYGFGRDSIFDEMLIRGVV